MERVWLVLIALALTAVAGCSDTAATVPAFSLQSEADAAAMEIDASAYLVGIVGFEYDNEAWGEFLRDDADGDAAFAALARGPDGRIGDGNARAWGYQYGTTGGTAIAVVVDAGGRVLYAGHAEGNGLEVGGLEGRSIGRGEALGRLLVDSDQAARIVAESNPAYASTIDAPDAIAFFSLGRLLPGAEPVWAIGAETDVQGGENSEKIGIVDAVDGSYSSAEDYLARILLVPTEHGSFSGAVDLTTPVEHRFTIQEDHPFPLGVGVHFDGGAPVGDAELTLTLPDGATREQTVAVAPGTAETHAFFLVHAPPEKGGYTLTVALPGGAAATYSAAWCAAGFIGLDGLAATGDCTASFEDGDPFGPGPAPGQPNRAQPYAW